MLIIDPGNSTIKATNGIRETITPSIIGPSQDVFAHKSIPTISGYFVGEDALHYADHIEYSLRELKSEQRTLEILIKYTLSLYPAEKEIVLILPFSNFFSEKERLIKAFRKDFTVHTLPQGFCALMDWLLDESGNEVEACKEYFSRPILVSDVGFGTINHIYFNRGRVNQNLSFSSLNGMHLIYSKIAAATGKNIYEVDLTLGADAVKPLYGSLASVLQTDIDSHYRLRDIGLHFICGGGGSALFPYIPWESKILHPSQFANVRGGLKVARKLWGSTGHSVAISN